jgi:hypothetical protein
VLHGLDHQVAEPFVERGREVVDVLGQAREAPAVEAGDDVDAGEDVPPPESVHATTGHGKPSFVA